MAKELWSFREAARELHAPISLLEKEADEGGALEDCLAPESEWREEQIPMFRKHYAKRARFSKKLKLVKTTEELSVHPDGTPKLVLRCLDAAKVRALGDAGFQARLKLRFLDEHEEEVFGLFGKPGDLHPVIQPRLKFAIVKKWLVANGAYDLVDEWVRRDSRRQIRWAQAYAANERDQKAWETKFAKKEA